MICDSFDKNMVEEELTKEVKKHLKDKFLKEDTERFKVIEKPKICPYCNKCSNAVKRYINMLYWDRYELCQGRVTT